LPIVNCCFSNARLEPQRRMSHDITAHLSNERQSSLCSIEEYRLPSAEKLERERHDSRHLGILVDGSFDGTGDNPFEAVGSTLVYYPAGSVAGADFRNDGVHFLWLAFESEWNDWPLEKYRHAGRTGMATDGRAYAAATRLVTLYLGPEKADTLLIDSAIEDILASLCDAEHHDTHPAPRWWSVVLDQLRSDDTNIDLVTLAQNADVHPSHLARSFKARTGQTIGEYRRMRRLQRATSMLSERSRSVAEIAADCGFFDQAHFCRIFKRCTGFTPSAYRAGAR